mmetsp:Transcript_43643/g.138032  ORF Transcript_43643/g.138032 Transcript_43643/m.138032 type:complete len:92 (+) Transcript_43643:519-794(+)
MGTDTICIHLGLIFYAADTIIPLHDFLGLNDYMSDENRFAQMVYMSLEACFTKQQIEECRARIIEDSEEDPEGLFSCVVVMPISERLPASR